MKAEIIYQCIVSLSAAYQATELGRSHCKALFYCDSKTDLQCTYATVIPFLAPDL